MLEVVVRIRSNVRYRRTIREQYLNRYFSDKFLSAPNPFEDMW